MEDLTIRWNRSLAPRPRITDCHVALWLASPNPKLSISPSAFSSAADVLASMQVEGSRWFSIFQNAETAYSFLQKEDWEIFCEYPLISGLGSRGSTRRLLYLAFLANRLNLSGEAQAFLREAESALSSYTPQVQPRYRKWLDRVRADMLM